MQLDQHTHVDNQLRPSTGNDAVKGGEQSLDFEIPTVKLLWNHEAIRNVLSTESELVDTPL